MGIGVAAVVMLTSLGEGARQYVLGEFGSLGSHLLVVLPAGAGSRSVLVALEADRDRWRAEELPFSPAKLDLFITHKSIGLTLLLLVFLRLRPVAVLGMGGFTAGPGGVIAWLLRRPLLIHEQNSVPGTTNRLLAPLARRVLEGFPGALPERYRPLHTGNPVRSDIAALPDPAERFRGRGHGLRLLVIGGSLGARVLNRTVPEAVARLHGELPVKVHHQTGAAEEPAREAGQAFFQGDIAAAVAGVAPDPAGFAGTAVSVGGQMPQEGNNFLPPPGRCVHRRSLVENAPHMPVALRWLRQSGGRGHEQAGQPAVGRDLLQQVVADDHDPESPHVQLVAVVLGQRGEFGQVGKPDGPPQELTLGQGGDQGVGQQTAGGFDEPDRKAGEVGGQGGLAYGLGFQGPAGITPRHLGMHPHCQVFLQMIERQGPGFGLPRGEFGPVRVAGVVDIAVHQEQALGGVHPSLVSSPSLAC